MSQQPQAERLYLTLEAWADLPEDEPGELVDGVLEEEEVASYVHELIVMLLGRHLGNWGELHGAQVLGSEWKLAVTARRGRKADVVVYLPGTARPPGRAKLGRTPPDVLIEVVTPTPRDARRDRVVKFDEYAAFGVRWYWIVDPSLRTLEISELVDGRYARALGASEGVVAIPGLEGLTLDLDAIWREVDALEAADAPEGQGATDT